MRVLLTGGTGYLGKHLLQRLLADGHEIVALVRPGVDEPLLRLHAALTAAGAREDAVTTLTVVPGDLTEPDCALSPTYRDLLRGCEVLVHSAGLTRFDTHLAEELTRQNVLGTQAAYRLAGTLAIPHFHHLSTAYVAGTIRVAFASQDFACGQQFHNPYEASKFEAERWLRAQGPGSGPLVTIHRPSIVVGGRPLGASNSVSTVYTFMKAVHFIRACCLREEARGGARLARLGVGYRGERFHLPLRLAADPDATINLVRIEDVTGGIATALMDTAAPHLTTYHLTGREYRLATLADALMEALNLEGLALVPPTTFTRVPRNPLEEQLARMTAVYTPYLFGSPVFLASPRTQPREIDPVALTIEFMRQIQHRRSDRQERNVGGLALETLAIDTPEDYFSALTRGAVGRGFLARHGYVDADVEFRLTGLDAGAARLRFAQGRVERVRGIEGRPPDCVYTLDSGLFMQIVTGERDLRAAFLTGHVRIDGHKELALKFGALLGLYYQHLDTRIVEELTA